MTAIPSLPPHLQPATKAPSTAKSSSLAAAANKDSPASRSSSKARPSRPRQNADGPEYTSDKATTALIRKILGPQTSTDARSSPGNIGDILPPLTSSNEVDLQLYAILAIVIKEFVQSWYSKITPDHVFVDEIVHLIAHCSRAIEERARRIDVEELIFDEIPTLVEIHIIACRTAYEACPNSAYHSTPLHVYHSLNPHPALSPVPDDDSPEARQAQHQNEVGYRQQLVQGALAVLLPTEDLQNPSLQTIVSDIIADLILGQAIGGNVCKPWFLHETIIRIVQVIRSKIEPKTTGKEIQDAARSRLDKFGLLSSKEEASIIHSPQHHQSHVSALFWRLLQAAFLLFVSVRFIVAGLFRARSLPSRSHSFKSTPPSPIAYNAANPSSPSQSWSGPPSTQLRPILNYRVLSMVSTLLDLSTRMPWLTGLLSLGKHGLMLGTGGLGSADSILDKFLNKTLHTHILPLPHLLPTILLNLRVSLFPFNTRGPPAAPDPSPAQQTQLKHKAAEALLSLIPRAIQRIYFSTGRDRPDTADLEDKYSDSKDAESKAEADKSRDQEATDHDSAISQIEQILSIVDDPYMNKHLIYNIIELVVARIVPEMTEKDVGELMAERGVATPNQDSKLE